jgi:phosphosulfolactate phosphohydrolase-like enzyme
LKNAVLMEVSMCDHDGPGWEDIALAGALAEEMAEKEKERERLKQEMERDEEEDR